MGTTEMFRGESFGSRTTLGEVQLIASVGGARHIMQAIWYDQNLRREIIRMQYRLGQTFQLEAVPVEMGGRGGQVDVSFKDLVWDVDFRIKTSPLWALDQQVLQTYIAVLNTVAPVAEMSSWLRMESLLKEIFFRIGDPGAENHLLTQEEHDALVA